MQFAEHIEFLPGKVAAVFDDREKLVEAANLVRREQEHPLVLKRAARPDGPAARRPEPSANSSAARTRGVNCSASATGIRRTRTGNSAIEKPSRSTIAAGRGLMVTRMSPGSVRRALG